MAVRRRASVSGVTSQDSRSSSASTWKNWVGQKLPGDGPALALHQHLDGAVGQPQELQDGRQGAQPVDFALPGFILAGVLLGAQQDVFLLPHGIFQGMDGAFPPDKQRHHHVGEDDDIPQGQHGHREQVALVLSTFAAVFGKSKNHYCTAIPGLSQATSSAVR